MNILFTGVAKFVTALAFFAFPVSLGVLMWAFKRPLPDDAEQGCIVILMLVIIVGSGAWLAARYLL